MSKNPTIRGENPWYLRYNEDTKKKITPNIPEKYKHLHFSLFVEEQKMSDEICGEWLLTAQ